LGGIVTPELQHGMQARGGKCRKTTVKENSRP
jgi:hypothetical protein